MLVICHFSSPWNIQSCSDATTGTSDTMEEISSQAHLPQPDHPLRQFAFGIPSIIAISRKRSFDPHTAKGTVFTNIIPTVINDSDSIPILTNDLLHSSPQSADRYATNGGSHHLNTQQVVDHCQWHVAHQYLPSNDLSRLLPSSKWSKARRNGP